MGSTTAPHPVGTLPTRRWIAGRRCFQKFSEKFNGVLKIFHARKSQALRAKNTKRTPTKPAREPATLGETNANQSAILLQIGHRSRRVARFTDAIHLLMKS